MICEELHQASWREREGRVRGVGEEPKVGGEFLELEEEERALLVNLCNYKYTEGALLNLVP